MIDDNMFKLMLVGTNKDGSKIFANLKCNSKIILKGFYSFEKELFIIIKYIAVVDDVKHPEKYYHFLDCEGEMYGDMNFIYGDKFKNLTMEDYFAFSNAILHMGKGKYNTRKIINEIQNNRI